MEIKSLLTEYPEIAKEWDYDKNENLRPENIAPKSKKKVWWICSLGHSYEMVVGKRTVRGDGCHYCSGHRVLKGFNDLETLEPEIAKEWNYELNGLQKPSDFTTGSAKKFWWKCPKGHSYFASIHMRVGKRTGCSVCNKRKNTSFAEQAIFYYVKQLFSEAINKYKEIFNHSMELDVYIPSVKIAIEYDGLLWHKEEMHERERKKYSICKDNNIKLIRIKEDNGNRWDDVADDVIYLVKNGTYKGLEVAIKEVIKSLSNYNKVSSSIINYNLEVDISRDRNKILNYLTSVENSLKMLRPDVVEKWDYEKNGNLQPEMFSVSSNQRVWWKCPNCGHRWECSINSMTRKGRYGCSICSQEQRLDSFVKTKVRQSGSLAETMPHLIKEWHPTKNGNITPYNITAGRFKKVWWLCSKCSYEWESSPNNRSKGVGCPHCSGRVAMPGVDDLITLNPEFMKEWDWENNKNLDPNQLKPGSGKRAAWICSKCNHKWKTIIAKRANGSGCPYCSKKRKNRGYYQMKLF